MAETDSAQTWAGFEGTLSCRQQGLSILEALGAIQGAELTCVVSLAEVRWEAWGYRRAWM